MPNTAPGAQRLAGSVEEDDASPAAPAHPATRAWRWGAVAVFLLVVVVLFDAYLHLSRTYAENSDEANILLMANDMLHGNVTLSGWNVSDVPFITTELPQIAVLVGIFGLRLGTAHIAAAMTYTLVVAVGMLLAKGRARGWAAVARMALALAIMLAPQPGVGIFVMIFSVGHIGTAVPVMLTWLVIDRLWPPGRTTAADLRRRWYVPVIVALLLGWTLMADPLVLVIAVLPLLAVCLIRLVSSAVGGARRGGGLRGLRQGIADRLFEVSLAVAAGIGYVIVLIGRGLLSSAGGYHQQPVPYALDATRTWFWHSRVVVHGLLEMFGAYFVPGQDPQQPLTHMDQAIALTRLVTVVLAVWGACAIARRMFFRDADFVSQLLLAGIIANIFAYVPSTLAAHTALNTREIVPVLAFAAVLAGRMLGDRLVSGPLASVRLPRFARSGAGAAGAGSGAYSLRVRLIAVPLVALFGWYSYGLFRQANTPPAPEPLAKLANFLEDNHLHYGLGGYWEASVLTVETGGKVTVRAVTPACMQPYKWESKPSWYDAKLNSANFVLLSQEPGYFTQFAVNGVALQLLNNWYGPPAYPAGWPHYYRFGGYYWAPASTPPHELVKIYYYTAREYPGNLLTQLPRIAKVMNNPPAVACS
jgi:hypothetical protein